MILTHPDQSLVPHDLWSAWNTDPLVFAGLLVGAWVFWSGRRRARRTHDSRRPVFFALALLTLAVALLSPLDALSEALASAHMVQHLLFTLVAAPLLVLSAPTSTLMRGAPAVVRRATGRWRSRLRLTPRNTAWLRHPAVAWLLYVGTLWFWHGAVPYDAGLASEPVHVLSHAAYLVTGVLFWRVVIDSARGKGVSPGLGVLLAFAAAMQSVFLSALLTFSGTSWYSGYVNTTAPWGLEPLADQQLAGAVMWIPGGLIYLGTALALLVGWIRESGPGNLLADSDDAGAPRRGQLAADQPRP
jgi:putative membrane protein